MAAGHRVRVLLEWYDPTYTEEQANQQLRLALDLVQRRFPTAVVQTYVERNPPDDEVQ